MKQMTVNGALNWASSFLEAQKAEWEKPAIEWLLRHHLQISRSQMFMMMHDEVEPEVFAIFCADVKKYSEGMPVQHLIGYEEFYGRPFKVNRNVLIPRPETEELVVAVLQKKQELFRESRAVSVLDVGTGSGAIAISLALEDAQLNVAAVDLSEAALQVAKENAVHLGAQVNFEISDLLQTPIKSECKFDIIVSNPPYIPIGEKATLAANVREHEPHLALFGGEDGYDLYRRLVRELPLVMNDRGLIAFEVGAGQTREVASMLREAFRHATVERLNDINGKDRIVLCYGDLN
ncbi:peptide chain release factor N(5)-glutamine methyltransferase [Alkalihalobacillus sp. 1P02AB]|uniref:peptide chain release factor N(5)-glutamine methyltransferase n=1 Tax=Alkalihalobacillus sp. 1P02AB TaxID=3132260 RepID=UPI0039A49121